MATGKIPETKAMVEVWLNQDGLAKALDISVNRVIKAVGRNVRLYQETKRLLSPTGLSKAYLLESLVVAVVHDIADRYPASKAKETFRGLPKSVFPPIFITRL